MNNSVKGTMSSHKIEVGDVKEVLSGMEDNSFHACLTDPPYGLSFMGKAWDHGVPSADVWKEVLRVLKPGAFLLAFGGTRTYHRLACAIEDAGFEVRDCLMWLYGSGFPKSHNFKVPGFDGYGTALKPAWEPCLVAMKPLDGTFANNALKHGVAGINVDAGRIAGDVPSVPQPRFGSPTGQIYGFQAGEGRSGKMSSAPSGRWPANLLLDESFTQEWARFFYCAKASRRERDAGLDGFEERRVIHQAQTLNNGSGGLRNGDGLPTPTKNHHPCLKPLDLNRYLASLVLPPEGERKILVPFSGSGSEMIGALLAGWDFALGIEKEEEYAKIAEARLSHWISPGMFNV